jgi:sulfoxide reductase catalytic subunit YedY
VEGCTIEEAANELAFLSVGMYGKVIPNQNGAPIRLTLPWKYGFKSAKSIVRVEFTDKRPVNFWQQLQDGEYGFWANVNPEVPHPRWSQAQERLLGTGEMVPTRIWNGYGEYVAALYAPLKSERLFA